MPNTSAGRTPNDRHKLVLGTAALGLPYGLPVGGAAAAALVDEATAATVVRGAFDSGITAFDTAPAYGVAEERLGRCLDPRARVWSKLAHGVKPGPELLTTARASLDASLDRLQRPALEALHWHNWSAGLLGDAAWVDGWSALTADPRCGLAACSTYGPEDALAAVESGLFRLVQVEWNLLNQRVLRAILEPARQRGVRIALRSVLLQGVLTPKGAALPKHLAALGPARADADDLAQDAGLSLHQLAIRAALDSGADHVLLGLDGGDQLAEALAAADAAPLDAATRAALPGLEVANTDLTDPRKWAAMSA